MLRVSAQSTETNVDLQAVNGDAQAAAQGIEYGAELLRFAEAVPGNDQLALAAARQQLLDAAGPAVVVDAAAVAANFQRMVRIADSTGIPIDDTSAELGQGVRAELGLERFPSARNTLTA